MGPILDPLLSGPIIGPYNGPIYWATLEWSYIMVQYRRAYFNPF